MDRLYLQSAGLTVAVLVAVLAGATIERARAESAPAESTAVHYDASPEALLVSFREINGEYAEEDPTPLVRIFGDGRVLAHYPRYSVNAGQYELTLDRPELERVLLTLLEQGVGMFDVAAARRAKRLAERSRFLVALASGEVPEVFGIEDATISEFEIHVDGYRPPGATAAFGPIDHTVRWPALANDAERFPELSGIRGLRTSEQTLRALLDHPNLRRKP